VASSPQGKQEKRSSVEKGSQSSSKRLGTRKKSELLTFPTLERLHQAVGNLLQYNRTIGVEDMANIPSSVLEEGDEVKIDIAQR
jgi:hypothetical protein